MTDAKKASGAAVFDRDVSGQGGYLYTTNAPWSSFIANLRRTNETLSICDFKNKRVLDVGCGDGVYTIELFDKGRPAAMHGIDLSYEGIKVANEKKGDRNIIFEVGNAASLSYDPDSFDIAHIRGLLHHMDNPKNALRGALRAARKIIVIESNGNNPVVKIIERFSRYHIEHHERSFSSVTLKRWVKDAGGHVVTGRFVGFVPFFCPRWLARILNFLEPIIERLPLIRAFSCAAYIFVAVKDDKK